MMIFMIENHLARIDLNLLVHLQLLLEEGSVTRAAARAGITQSAMSRVLSRLRDLFDDPLFVRTSSGLRPTVRAERLVAPLREVLLRLQAELLAPATFDPETARTAWSICSADMADALLLTEVCRRVAAQAPGVTLHLRGPMVESRALIEGQVDLALGLPGEVDASLRTRSLFSDTFACVVRCGHPALDADGRLGLEAYAALSHVLVAPRGRPGGVVDRELAARGLSRHVAVTTPSFLLAPALVVGTDLVLTMPRRLAQRFSSALPLTVVDAPLEVPGFTIALIWHERWQHDPGHAWLRSLVCRVADELDAVVAAAGAAG